MSMSGEGAQAIHYPGTDRRNSLGLEGVVGSTVVEVVAEASNEHGKDLQIRKRLFHLTALEGKGEGTRSTYTLNHISQPMAQFSCT